MKALIFDCDGVLVDSEALAEETLETHLGQWLPDLDIPTLLSQALGMTTADILKHLAQLSRHQLPPDASERLDEALGDVPIFAAEQVDNPKPDPAIYRVAAHELGCPPSRCLVVEDSVAGVPAAHAAGMRVIGFVGASHIDDEQPNRLLAAGAWRILPHMRGLRALVDEWQLHLQGQDNNETAQ